MKALVFLLITCATSIALAVPVDGEIFYKLPSGKIASRSVTMDVPSRGAGDVILSGNNFEWRTADFWTDKIMGKAVFSAAFQEEFMGITSTIVFQGTYLNGADRILYSGDFYKKDGHGPVSKDLAGFTYTGGFIFEYAR